MAKQVDTQQPVEVAFGMATRANIKGAVDRLVERGATKIVAVPSDAIFQTCQDAGSAFSPPTPVTVA